jgi:hypothetical protein
VYWSLKKDNALTLVNVRQLSLLLRGCFIIILLKSPLKAFAAKTFDIMSL